MVPIVHKHCLRIVLLLRVLLFSLGMVSRVIKSHVVQDFCKFSQHNKGERGAAYIQLSREDVTTTAVRRCSLWKGPDRRLCVCMMTAGLTGCQKPRDIYIFKSCYRALLAFPLQCQECSSKKKTKLCAPIYAWRFSWLHFLIIIQGCPWGLIAFWILIFATACLLSIRPANLFLLLFHLLPYNKDKLSCQMFRTVT